MRTYHFFQTVVATLLIGILAVALVSDVSAETIRVDLNGGDDYFTIQEGVNAAKEGDTLMVDPGVYKESVEIDKEIVLIGYGPEATAIYAVAGNAVVFKEENGEAEIIGFSVTSAGENGIYCEGGSPGISNNVISGGKNGIYCSAFSIAAISNNVIIGCGSDGVYVRGESTSTVVNNIITENGRYGISYNSGAHWGPRFSGAGPASSYNDFWNNSQGDYGGDWSGYISVGPGNIAEDPLFVDPGVDFHLQENSPCIDAGKPGFASLDPDGTRNDIGAYGGPYGTISGRGPVITNLEITPTSVEEGGTIIFKAIGSVQ